MGLLFLLIKKGSAEEKPFNQIELSSNNNFNNGIFPAYYDTILSVAMDEMGLVGNNVVIEKLSDNAREQFDGQLRAHIRYYNGSFYLFTEELDRSDAIEVLSHEVLHMQQYISGDLVYDNLMVIWKGDEIGLDSREYEERPWETDAYRRQANLIELVEKKLYD